MSTPRLDDLFDFSRLDKKAQEPTPPPPEPVRRRRVVRDREALKSMRPVPESTPIDMDAQVVAARSAVRERTSRALESLGVDAAQPAARPAPRVEPPRPAALRWRLVVRCADAALEFFVGGADVVDAVTQATPAIAGWMRTHRAGATWRVEAVEDLAGAML